MRLPNHELNAATEPVPLQHMHRMDLLTLLKGHVIAAILLGGAVEVATVVLGELAAH